MIKNIPEEIYTSNCGSFCLAKCQFLVECEDSLPYWCLYFAKALSLFIDKPSCYAVRCVECRDRTSLQ